ncbi:hypothetical protein H5410_051281, partial [Solanum commersonii]
MLTSPAPSSSSAPAPKNKGDFKSQKSQNSRARPIQSQGACRDGSNGFFKCGQISHFMRECPKNRKFNGNGGNKP